jgi:hypothetical protein
MMAFAMLRLSAAALSLALTGIGAAQADGVIKGGTLIITPGVTVQGGFANVESGPTPSSLRVACRGGSAYVLDTGNDNGTCTVRTDDAGDVETARCDDGSGNVAAVVCTADDGKGACGENAGSGTCQPQ